jgi:hypothetical protein
LERLESYAVVACYCNSCYISTMSWLLLAYKVPTDPSSYRVEVWRQVRRLGAISLQQGLWALPDSKANRRALHKLAARVNDIGGHAYLLEGRAIDRETRVSLESAYTQSLEAEYAEFLDECRKYGEEVRREIGNRKFTHAELAEEEEALERLRRWLESLATRDLLGSPMRAEADGAMKTSSALLDEFAGRVFDHEGG